MTDEEMEIVDLKEEGLKDCGLELLKDIKVIGFDGDPNVDILNSTIEICISYLERGEYIKFGFVLNIIYHKLETEEYPVPEYNKKSLMQRISDFVYDQHLGIDIFLWNTRFETVFILTYLLNK